MVHVVRALPNLLTSSSPRGACVATAPLDDTAPVNLHLYRARNAKAARYGVPAGHSLPHDSVLTLVSCSTTRPFLHSQGFTTWLMALLGDSILPESPASLPATLVFATKPGVGAWHVLANPSALAGWVRQLKVCLGKTQVQGRFCHMRPCILGHRNFVGINSQTRGAHILYSHWVFSVIIFCPVFPQRPQKCVFVFLGPDHGPLKI